MNLLELQVCNRVPEPLYQSKRTTGIRKLLPLKIKYFSHFNFNYIWNPTAYFHSISQEQNRRRENASKDMSSCETQSCIKGVHRNKSDKEIDFMFLLCSSRHGGVPALK